MFTVTLVIIEYQIERGTRTMFVIHRYDNPAAFEFSSLVFHAVDLNITQMQLAFEFVIKLCLYEK